MGMYGKLHVTWARVLRLTAQNKRFVFKEQYAADARALRVQLYTFYRYLKRTIEAPGSAEELKEALELWNIKENLTHKVNKTTGEKAVLELVWQNIEEVEEFVESQIEANSDGVQPSPNDVKRVTGMDWELEARIMAQQAEEDDRVDATPKKPNRNIF